MIYGLKCIFVSGYVSKDILSVGGLTWAGPGQMMILVVRFNSASLAEIR